MAALRRSAYAILGLLFAAPAQASAGGEIACYSNGKYSVAATENDDASGMRFAVSAGDAPCTFDESGPALIIGDGTQPLWFADLRGNHLVLTRSTGPSGDLVVYDLSTGLAVLDVPSDEFEAYDGGITYWQRVGEGTPANCSKFSEYRLSGFGAAIAQKNHFEFLTNAAETTGEQRCDPVQ